jgi:hypothetical protein
MDEIGIVGVVVGDSKQILPPGMPELLYDKECKKTAREAVSKQKGKTSSKEELEERKRLSKELEEIDEKIQSLKKQAGVEFTVLPQDAEGNPEKETVTCTASGADGEWIRGSAKPGTLLVVGGTPEENSFVVKSITQAYSPMALPRSASEETSEAPKPGAGGQGGEPAEAPKPGAGGQGGEPAEAPKPGADGQGGEPAEAPKPGADGEGREASKSRVEGQGGKSA